MGSYTTSINRHLEVHVNDFTIKLIVIHDGETMSVELTAGDVEDLKQVIKIFDALKDD